MATPSRFLRAVATIVAAGMFTLSVPSVSYAHWDRYGHGGWRHGDGWRGGWGGGRQGGWGWGGGIVIGPPLIYRPPPPVYYAPPPAYYYAPPPTYYYAPPPAYYGRQGYYQRY